MLPTIQALVDRVNATTARLRATYPRDPFRANRYRGRAEVLITRYAAILGEPIPLLYVSCDGQWLTTWPGNRVARLQVTGKAPAFGCTLTCYRATIAGRVYYGRGHGPGMYLKLRPSKVSQ